MVVHLSVAQLYSTRDPNHFHDGLLKDTKLLWDAEAYPSCLTLIVCFVDAMAGGSKQSFLQFMEAHFPVLCGELYNAVPGKPGALTFYEKFRNGLAHLRGPKTGYALARDSETGGKHVEIFEVQGKRYAAISVDRLYADFVIAVEKSRLLRMDPDA